MIVADAPPTYIEAMKRILKFRRLAGAMAVAALALTFGCGGGGTTPDDGLTPVITFTPEAQAQQITVGQNTIFRVAVDPEVALTVTWRRGAAVVGTSRDYAFAASQVGRDTLRVRAEAARASRDYYWVIDVAPEAQTVPPPVPGVSVAPGQDPVQVTVSWSRVNASTYPLVDYVVAISYAGQITVQNWGDAQVLGEVAHVAGQVNYTRTFGHLDAGLVPGAEAWIAIRARDDRGQLSAEFTNRFTRITTEWWIYGRVTDDAGEPLVAVSLASSPQVRNGNSDGGGRFRLGPYRSIDTVTVQTATIEYYDLTTARLGSAVDVERDIVLPFKHGVDPSCTGYDGDFLTYLRHMTRTQSADADTAASRLWKWERYPVSVFLPDSTTASGRDLDGLARAMLELWNSEMGETYVVEATSAATADVRVEWTPDILGGYGSTALDLPAGGVLGDVAPIRVRVRVAAVIEADQFFMEVVLHEFGHALGLVKHSDLCPGSGHLMLDGGGGGNLDLEFPIHPDEMRAVRTIRRLAQGVDMRRYAP